MRICRFTTAEIFTPRFGLLEDDLVLPLAKGELIETFDPHTEKGISIAEVNFLAPVAPSKIVCVGRNYVEHAAELGNKMPDEPLLFLKAPSALIANGESIELPPQSNQVEHEGELGVVISRRARKLTEGDDPLGYVLGYTCVNDVTARDLQRKDVQFTRGKSFDTFCPVGPSIVTGIDPLNLECRDACQRRRQAAGTDVGYGFFSSLPDSLYLQYHDPPSRRFDCDGDTGRGFCDERR